MKWWPVTASAGVRQDVQILPEIRSQTILLTYYLGLVRLKRQ
jgi:hypothetical protein